MLDSLRSAVNSWPAKILLCLILLSFIAWGGHSALQQSSDDTLLTAGGKSVSAAAYNISLRDESLRLSMRIGRFLTPDEMKRFGVEQSVYDMLSRNALLDNAADGLKLGVSDKSAAALLAADPLFSGDDGKFDLAAFNMYLQNLRVRRDYFLGNFYKQPARRAQLTAPLQSGADAPEVFYRALALYQLQSRAVDYAALSSADIGLAPEPDAAVLARWFAENQSRFRTEEYRQISAVSLTPQDISNPAAVSDAAIAAYYQAHRERYLETAEKRSFELLRFSDKKAADQAAAAIAAARQNGQSPQQAFSAEAAKLGRSEQRQNVPQAALPALLGAEIFSLPQGAISPVINDLQGPVLAYITGSAPAKPKALSAAAGEIRADIAKQQALAALPDYRKKIEDARFDGADLKSVAAQHHLKLQTETLSKQGLTPQGAPSGLPQNPALLSNIFAAAENVDTDPLSLTDGGYLWYNVDNIIPPRDSSLAEVRTRAAQAWQREQQQQKLDSRATDLAKQLSKGADFAALAKQNGLKLTHLDNLRRSPADEKLGDAAVAAIFSVMAGESGLTVGPQADSRLIFKVQAIHEPENAGRALLSANEQAEIAARFSNDLLGLYIGAQAQQTPITVNPTVYRRLLQNDSQ